MFWLLTRLSVVAKRHFLERIKHLFDIPNIILVLLIDKGRLEECVKGIYGEGAYGTEYLRRFIDFEFALPDTSSKDNIKILLSLLGLYNQTHGYDVNTFAGYFTLASEMAELTIRTKEKSIALLRVAIEYRINIDNADLLALLIVLKAYTPQNIHRFINGTLIAEEAFPRLTYNLNTWLTDNPLTVGICAWLVMADRRVDHTKFYTGNSFIEKRVNKQIEQIKSTNVHNFLDGMNTYIKQTARGIDLL